jgi:1-pyrroline-5-carboxylate dehydrogenase
MILQPENEKIYEYAPGSAERKALKDALHVAITEVKQLPMYIGREKIFTSTKIKVAQPHCHASVLAYLNEGTKEHVRAAIEAALAAKKSWQDMPWENRAGIFLKAAGLISGPYRARINAATMLGQSKNVYQAEIDAACEMADFLRFNVEFARQIYSIQPISPDGIRNSMQYRPLEGFVFALTPFNFTAIAGNLATAPAMLGNTVVWKPAYTQAYSADLLMQIFLEAGLPAGVINLIYADGPQAGEVIFAHPDFAGIHFTGSTAVFQTIWSTIGQNISKYRSYPRIVGETGGKDFVLAHASADVKALSTALIRGAFEYQGQKCSAASRAYLPSNLWEEIKKYLVEGLGNIKMGSPEDFRNFINAVIDERSFDKIVAYIENARNDKNVEIIAGGKYDKSIGYFIEPTVLLTSDPNYITMREEIFGPVLTVYIYQPDQYDEVMKLIDSSRYALTGAVFSQDHSKTALASLQLVNAAGNFYINDKPTGAVVGQQPFGGARASGTNDKAGSLLNLLRWVSARTIKENFAPPTDYSYPFMKES